MNKGLLGGSFVLANGDGAQRMIIAVDGLDKSGKNHFAFTAPAPIACQSTDIGTEGVIEQFSKVKPIWLAHYRTLIEKGDSDTAIIKKHTPVWDRFVTDFREVVIPGLKTGALRTVVWDTATEIWELLRLARYGKLQQINPFHYAAMNQEFQALVKEVYLDTPGNMVLLHKVGDEYKLGPSGMSDKTGELERKGHKDSAFIVQINVTCSRERLKGDKAKMPTGPFHLTVRNCRQNAECAGLDLEGEMATFPWLGVHVFPDSDLSEWE